MKFKYLDRVKFVSGFYEGHVGNVVSIFETFSGNTYHNVELEDITVDNVDICNLEKVDD